MSYIFYTAILLGVLVFVHELGHFLVAKFFDVKVIRFSIGMGPKVFGFTYGETEYIFGALPLGGYVMMAGMSFEQSEDMDPAERNRSLMMKPIWQRTLVTLAGPVFNLIFPVILYFIIITFTYDQMNPALIGQVFGAPAKSALLEPGDKIIEIDGNPVYYWHEMSEFISDRANQTFPLIFERDGKKHSVNVTPESISNTDFLGTETHYGLIGISMTTYGSIISVDSEDSIAAKAGFQDFDTIIAINGTPIRRYDKLISTVRKSKGEELVIDVLRSKKYAIDYAGLYERIPLQIKTRAICEETCTLDFQSAELVLSEIEKDSPAGKDGFQQGDRLLRIDGQEYKVWVRALSAIHKKTWEETLKQKDEGKEAEDIKISLEIEFMRKGEVQKRSLNPVIHGLDFPDFSIGFKHISNSVGPEKIDFPIGKRIAFAATYSFTQTWEFIGLTAKGLARMFSGQLSMDNLSGPIGIGTMAAEAGKAGWDKFLEMMAVISINLALVNLIPIPMLDGGNLMLYALETIKRGPLSFRTRQIATYIGFSLIIVLFIFAFKNDIENNWAVFADWLNELF